MAQLRSVRWVTFWGHHQGLSILQITCIGPVDLRATLIDLPKRLVTLDGRGSLFFPHLLTYSLHVSDTALLQPDCCPQVEKLVPPPDGHDTTGEINPAIHGFNGPVEISVQNIAVPISSRIFNTTAELPEFPFNEDMNSGDPLGMGVF